MPLNTYTTISIDGREFRHYEELTIQQCIDGHHTFELYINNEWLSASRDGIFSGSRDLLGKEIHIHIAAVELSPNIKPLYFRGLITAVHAGKEGDTTQGFCIIRGEDPGVLLDGVPQMQVYEDQPLERIANHCLRDLTPQTGIQVAPGNTAIHPYTVQYKETNFAFLRRLAARFGEWFFYDGQRMIFGAYTPAKIILSHPAELVNFDLKLQLTANNSTFSNYDYRNSSLVTANTYLTAPGILNPLSSHTLTISNKLYVRGGLCKTGEHITGDFREGLHTLAKMQGKKCVSAQVQLTGRSKNPGIRIGDIIHINETYTPQDLEGSFTVTRITHHCKGDGAYHNDFLSMPADCCIPPGNSLAPSHCEAQSATVTDNHDPEGMGRVRVRYRWQPQGSSPWIRIISPHGGAGKGFYFIPEKGEEVWVDFEGGNPELPFVLGTAYNGKAQTKFGDAGNNLKIIRTRSGHTIRMDDSNGEEELQIKDRNGNTITMDTQAGNITIAAPGHLLLKARNISIQASDQVDIHAGENMTQGAGENMSIYAGNNATLLSTHIIQQARENFMRTSRNLEEQSENILINSIKENLTLLSSKTIAINGVEKIKLS